MQQIKLKGNHLRGQKKMSKVNKPPRRFDMYHIRETIQTKVGAMNKLN